MKKIWYLILCAVLIGACSAPATPAPTVVPTAPPPLPPTQSLPTVTVPTVVVAATPTVKPTLPSIITSKYLLSFHACDTATNSNCNSPQNHQVYLAQSDDGVSWKIIPNWKPFKGSVPDVIRRGNTLYIYTASSEMVKYNLETGVTETKRVKINGLNTGFADPSLILKDGQLVLFMLNGFVPNGDPAACPPGQATCEKYIDSATEVKGSDGTEFNLDSVHRLTVTLGGEYRTASDPDIFYDGKQYVLYVSHGPSVSAWTATDLQGTYKAVTKLSTNIGGIPAGFFEANQYWTYVHTNENGRAVIRRATHSALAPLTAADFKTILTGTTLGLGDKVNVESPGFAVNTP